MSFRDSIVLLCIEFTGIYGGVCHCGVGFCTRNQMVAGSNLMARKPLEQGHKP